MNKYIYRLSMLRLLWPPGMLKKSHQFMLPKMGLVFPKVIMPEKRFKLFPTESKKRYPVSEIYSWCVCMYVCMYE
jgi:hypothetical protein